MATEILFSDIDLNFLPNPLTKDISKKINNEAIKQSFKLLLLSMFYERPFNSGLGSPINKILFEPMSPMLNVILQKNIEQVIANHEPRVIVDSVNVALREEENAVDIKIYYRILNTSALQVFDIILERTR